jgi:hypothetical protein
LLRAFYGHYPVPTLVGYLQICHPKVLVLAGSAKQVTVVPGYPAGARDSHYWGVCNLFDCSLIYLAILFSILF